MTAGTTHEGGNKGSLARVDGCQTIHFWIDCRVGWGYDCSSINKAETSMELDIFIGYRTFSVKTTFSGLALDGKIDSVKMVFPASTNVGLRSPKNRSVLHLQIMAISRNFPNWSCPSNSALTQDAVTIVVYTPSPISF